MDEDAVSQEDQQELVDQHAALEGEAGQFDDASQAPPEASGTEERQWDNAFIEKWQGRGLDRELLDDFESPEEAQRAMRLFDRQQFQQFSQQPQQPPEYQQPYGYPGQQPQQPQQPGQQPEQRETQILEINPEDFAEYGDEFQNLGKAVAQQQQHIQLLAQQLLAQQQAYQQSFTEQASARQQAFVDAVHDQLDEMKYEFLGQSIQDGKVVALDPVTASKRHQVFQHLEQLAMVNPQADIKVLVEQVVNGLYFDDIKKLDSRQNADRLRRASSRRMGAPNGRSAGVVPDGEDPDEQLERDPDLLRAYRELEQQG